MLAVYCSSDQVVQEQPEEEVLTLSPREYLERMTFISACQGNKASRDWCMENIFGEKKEKKQRVTKHEIIFTDSNIVDQVVSGLSNLGHTKTSARQLVKKLTSSKSYNTVEDLLNDALKTR